MNTTQKITEALTQLSQAVPALTWARHKLRDVNGAEARRFQIYFVSPGNESDLNNSADVFSFIHIEPLADEPTEETAPALKDEVWESVRDKFPKEAQPMARFLGSDPEWLRVASLEAGDLFAKDGEFYRIVKAYSEDTPQDS